MCRWVFLSLEQLVVCKWLRKGGLLALGLSQGDLQAECPSFRYSLMGDPSARSPPCTALMTEVLCGSCRWAGVCRLFVLDSCHSGSHNWSVSLQGQQLFMSWSRWERQWQNGWWTGHWTEVIKRDLRWAHLEQAPGLALACGTGTDLSAGRSLFICKNSLRCSLLLLLFKLHFREMIPAGASRTLETKVYSSIQEASWRKMLHNTFISRQPQFPSMRQSFLVLPCLHLI